MAVVVATRMKFARWRDMPRFLRGSLAAGRQASRSPGLLAGRLRAEAPGVYWTLTMWASPRDMRAYRDGGVHAILVPRLAGWASEAVFGVWQTDASRLPTWAEASRRIADQPNFAPLDRPSESHRNAQFTLARRVGLDLPIRASRSTPAVAGLP
ncbi:MAG: hypothetical protein JWQ70_1977 [Aeromicrobium sp.]|nr:hypothetical protein [Aeromicrobium sp.]